LWFWQWVVVNHKITKLTFAYLLKQKFNDLNVIVRTCAKKLRGEYVCVPKHDRQAIKQFEKIPLHIIGILKQFLQDTIP